MARITNEFEIWQNNTKIPGLWPLSVDTSGCKKPEQVYATPVEHSLLNGPSPLTVPKPAAVNETLAPATAKSHDSSGNEAKAVDDKTESVLSNTEAPLDKAIAQSSDATLDSDELGIATSRKTMSSEAKSEALTPAAEGRNSKSTSSQRDDGIDTDEAEKAPTRKHASPANDEQENPQMSKRQLAMENMGTAPSPSGSPSKAWNSSILHKSSGPNSKASAQEFEAIEQKGGIIPQTPLAEEAECEPQGFASSPTGTTEKYGLGGEADSVYEYLPKQYLLLGGLKLQYRTMYEKAVEAANKYLLFRPMLPDARDIRVLGSASFAGKPDLPRKLRLYPQQEHLLCFAGGMYAMGSRIFDRKADLDIATKLTDGCVWAYESTITGIMPEGFMMMPCDNMDKCDWNQTRWNDKLDPHSTHGEQGPRSSQQALLRAQQQHQRQQQQHHHKQQQQQRPSPTQSPVERESSVNGDRAETQVTSESESISTPVISGPLTKRQLEFVQNDPQATAKSTTLASDELPNSQLPMDSANATIVQGPELGIEEDTTAPLDTLKPTPTRDELVESRRKELRLPMGVTHFTSSKYILR